MITLKYLNYLRLDCHIGTVLGTLLTLTIFVVPGFAQSADPNNPAPLKPGVNSGTADSAIGPLFYTFIAEPGESKVIVNFSSMGLLGNSTRSTIGIDLYDDKRSWKTHVELTSQGPAVERIITGNLKKRTNVILRIQPPPNGLLRQGGSYTVEVTGAVANNPEGSTDRQNPILGTYRLRGGYREVGNDVAVKFNSDGTLQLSDDNPGSWKLFDRENMIYVVTIRGESKTLKLIRGKGLVESENGVIVFLKLRSN
jgi:hypothetical protein